MIEWSPEELVSDMELYKKAEAYNTRLTRATKLKGAARLAVLRNIYRRMVRWSEEIEDDLQTRLLELSHAQETYADDEAMKGRIIIAASQLEQALTTWSDVAMVQNSANLRRLESILLATKNDTA